MQKMKPYWKRRWLTALRSGEYVQGQGRLCTRSDVVRWCCLGVLVDIAGIGDWEFDRDSTRYIFTEDVTDFRNTLLPTPKVLDTTGLTTAAANALAHMNDAQNKSFDEIADWIEANL